MDSMNINQFLEDTDAIVDYLRDRFTTRKVIIAGLSWGSIIGTKYSAWHPEKVSAYIGMSQFVNHKENQRLALEWLHSIANNKNDKKMIGDLESIGEPLVIGEQEELLMKHLAKNGGDVNNGRQVEKANIFGMIKPSLFSPDYTLKDIYKAAVSGATFSLVKAAELQAEINNVNLNAEVTQLSMPVYIFQGKHDKITNYGLTKEYYERLAAPAGKEFITLEQSAHYPNPHDFEIIVEKLKEISAVQLP